MLHTQGERIALNERNKGEYEEKIVISDAKAAVDLVAGGIGYEDKDKALEGMNIIPRKKTGINCKLELHYNELELSYNRINEEIIRYESLLPPNVCTLDRARQDQVRVNLQELKLTAQRINKEKFDTGRLIVRKQSRTVYTSNDGFWSNHKTDRP